MAGREHVRAQREGSDEKQLDAPRSVNRAVSTVAGSNGKGVALDDRP
jgi:hypothetical protein